MKKYIDCLLKRFELIKTLLFLANNSTGIDNGNTTKDHIKKIDN